MSNQIRGSVPTIDHSRVRRATAPRLRQPVPALNIPIEGANQTLDKPTTTLNRAGSSAANPILAGLGWRMTIQLDSSDELQGLYIYQERSSLGPNLKDLASEGPDGLYVFDLVAGAGRTVKGTPSTGAKKNYIRIRGKYGTFEREFWIKSYDYDVVALNGMPALDPDTLTKVAIDVEQIDPSLSWLDVVIDYMVSWNDEFQALHNAGNPYLDPGFLKAYGGAKFVSLFETGMNEGEGTVVNPVTQVEIKDQHKVQLQNTEGLKNFTVRFRSAKDSPYWVDVDVCVNVVAVVCDPSNPPDDGGNGGAPPGNPNIAYIPPQDPPHTPEDVPGSYVNGNLVPYSIEGQAPVTFDEDLEIDIIVLTVQAAAVGSPATALVRRWAIVTDTTAYWGVKLVFVSEKEYTPLILSATVPSKGGPYQSPKAYRVSFPVNQEITDGIAFYEVAVKDGLLTSQPTGFLSPKLDDLVSKIQKGTGVTDPPAPT